MIIKTPKGLYCPAGDFYIDPSRAVPHAVITHAHSDHARRGSKQYYCVEECTELLKYRLGKNIATQSYRYGEQFTLGAATVSFHSAGHILGSAQVRIECHGEVWVISGDYKREADLTCVPFEVVPCDVFITEATFGTPAFQWQADANVAEKILHWWQDNRKRGWNSVLFAYSLGKAQRVLSELAKFTDDFIFCHSATDAINDIYRDQKISLAPTISLQQLEVDQPLENELIITPPGTHKREMLGRYQTAFASGWMVNNNRFDEGFIISDHADWQDLLRTIEDSQAKRVYVQHRGAGALVKELRRRGIKADSEDALIPENPQQCVMF